VDPVDCAHPEWVLLEVREGRGRLDKVLRCVDCDAETVEPGQAAERPPLNFGAGAAT
jgi:hypothetical protein